MCVRPWTECAECCQAMVICPPLIRQQEQQPAPPLSRQQEQQHTAVAVECGECLRGMRAQQPPPQHAREQQQRGERALPPAASSRPHHPTPQQMREELKRGERALLQAASSRPQHPTPQQMREEKLQRGERALPPAASSRPHHPTPQQMREEELQRGERALPPAACSRPQQPSPQPMEQEQQLSYEDFPLLRRRLQMPLISSHTEPEVTSQQRETRCIETERHSTVEEVRYKTLKVRVFPGAHFRVIDIYVYYGVVSVL
ncbi:mediator of RNA polymerase II transcription subunit 15-like [Ischnura elegans]|uniref:mediator of RNA polymerase II transcription subunit 15-like n=2 Tax=Ischnura elegans TaxID=197161 RepID=UPI001ED8A420|nr:mediator of RNA polymerase II transcription subunit 15-like [Ischnura elegans]